MRLTNEQREQVITLRRKHSLSEVASLAGLSLGTVKAIISRSGLFTDNPRHRAMFTLPPRQSSGETLPAVQELPPPSRPGEPLSSGRHLADLHSAQIAQFSQKRKTTGAAQNGCSLAGSLSSTRDCGGLSWLGNCAKCAIRTAQNCAICARRETQRTGEEGQERTTTARTPSRVRPRNEKKAVTLADASRMATLCEPSQAPKYGLKYGPAHTKKDKPATGAGLRGICGGETVRRNPF